MKILIHDTDEAQRAMEDADIPHTEAFLLRGKTLEAERNAKDGVALKDWGIPWRIPPAAFKSILLLIAIAALCGCSSKEFRPLDGKIVRDKEGHYYILQHNLGDTFFVEIVDTNFTTNWK